MKNQRLAAIIAAALLGCMASTSHATYIAVDSYSMPNNGRTGTYNYRDTSYSNCVSNSCNTNDAPLSGGTGKLTDGIVPTQSWDKFGAPGDDTPYVGWVQYDPTITFNFSSTVHIDSVSLLLDNTPGWGDVRLPDYITINGIQFQIDTDSNWGPRTITFSGLDLDVSSINLQLFRDLGPFPNRWIMLGEVSFDDGMVVDVPEPGSLALLGLGLAGLVTLRRNRKVA
jgi:hypothetical protein